MKNALLCGEGQMLLDYRHGHDIEDSAKVDIFWVGKFVVAPASVVGCLNMRPCCSRM